MRYEIVQVERHRIDENALKITLRSSPNALERLFLRADTTQTYQGYPGHWYTEHHYQAAPAHVCSFLDKIARNPEFRHLRLKPAKA